MSIERAKEYFRTFHIEDRILEFDVSSATVELAAQALSCEAARIAKSLTFKVHEQSIMILTAGDAKIDNKKYKAVFGTKAKMLTPEEVETLIGHSIGGVCPFGINDGVDVYLDESMKKYDYLYPAAGSSNSAIKLTIAELEQYSGYKTWIDVCRDI